jgi:UPF0042 nucleotide-binding protein
MKQRVFIITGMSGAGKSQALKCFEDFGFYCIDNLPVKLIPALSDLIKKEKYFKNIALGLDIREAKFFKNLIESIRTIEKLGMDNKIIFMDSADEVLLQRFSETRHRHPLGKNISKAIKEERKILCELKERADKVIDTSKLTLGELKEMLSSLLELKKTKEVKISVLSFGYKYGLPIDADLVFDVRFLPNPYYVKALRYKTGLDKQVANYISRNVIYKKFLNSFLNQIKMLLPLYVKEGKSYLTIAIGCTGGKHRSVFLAHKIAENLSAMNYSVSEYHRDIRK